MKKILLRAIIAMVLLVKAYHMDIIELPISGLYEIRGTVTEESLVAIEDSYAKIPETVRASFEEQHGQIVIVGNELSILEEAGFKEDAEYKAYAEENGLYVVGLHNRLKDKVYIKASEIKDIETGALIHEIGHHVGTQGIKQNHYRVEWKEIWQMEGQYVSNYAAENEAEGFAECFKEMIMNKDNFKVNFPMSYEYIQRCIERL